MARSFAASESPTERCSGVPFWVRTEDVWNGMLPWRTAPMAHRGSDSGAERSRGPDGEGAQTARGSWERTEAPACSDERELALVLAGGGAGFRRWSCSGHSEAPAGATSRDVAVALELGEGVAEALIVDAQALADGAAREWLGAVAQQHTDGVGEESRRRLLAARLAGDFEVGMVRGARDE